MENKTPKLFMTFNSEFTGIRVINQMLIPTKWTIQADFVSNEDVDEPDDKPYNEGSISYQVLDFWMTQLLDDVLVINPRDPFSLKLALMSSNLCMTIPGTPTDDFIVQALFEKMNAICKSRLQILKLSVTSLDSVATYHFVDTINNSTLPDISYVGEGMPTEFKEPWWKRSTASCNDLINSIPEEDEEDVTELDDVRETDVLDHYEQQLRDMMDSEGVFEASPELEVDIDFSADPSIEDDLGDDVIEPEWNKKT